MSEFDLSTLSVEGLKSLKCKLEEEIQNKRKQELVQAKQEIESILSAYGFSLDEVMNTKATKIIKPKYQNPDNPEQVWTGRGRKPIWVNELLESGVTLDSLLINS